MGEIAYGLPMPVADPDFALQTLSSECVAISSVLTVFSCQDELLHNVDWQRVETHVATNRTEITVFVFVCLFVCSSFCSFLLPSLLLSFFYSSSFPLFFFDLSSFLNVSFLLILSFFLSSLLSFVFLSI